MLVLGRNAPLTMANVTDWLSCTITIQHSSQCTCDIEYVTVYICLYIAVVVRQTVTVSEITQIIGIV